MGIWSSRPSFNVHLHLINHESDQRNCIPFKIVIKHNLLFSNLCNRFYAGPCSGLIEINEQLNQLLNYHYPMRHLICNVFIKEDVPCFPIKRRGPPRRTRQCKLLWNSPENVWTIFQLVFWKNSAAGYFQTFLVPKSFYYSFINCKAIRRYQRLELFAFILFDRLLHSQIKELIQRVKNFNNHQFEI